jgi:hypothetical protein
VSRAVQPDPSLREQDHADRARGRQAAGRWMSRNPVATDLTGGR